MLAVTLYTQVLDRFPEVRSVKPGHWDFIVTIGGIFVGVSQLNHEELPEAKKDMLLESVTRELIGYYPDGHGACEDCRQFVDRTYNGLAKVRTDPTFLFSDSLGAWVAWNLFGHAPENEKERQLARAIGGLLVDGFVKWWK
ncbi:MAG: hypothetical protein HY747_01700 [Elusimicrobia bacterium]|nr:hypothetical protein [Elusimicrobiota bacterium]